MTTAPVSPPSGGDASPLIHLNLIWFSSVMGLSGLALAWTRAVPVMGLGAHHAAIAIAAVAAVVWLALALATFARVRRYPVVVALDVQHPVRHAFVAAVPIGLLLLVALGTHFLGPRPLLHGLWVMAAAAQLLVTLWVLGRWLHEHRDGEPPMWVGITPALFIPIVGNVVAPLGGLALGHEAWSLAQLAVGVFFWPLVLVLVLVRRAAHSALPPRMLMAWFITAAPPSVVGVVSVQLGASVAWSLALWGIALFSLLWAVQVVRRALAVGFHMGFWGVSFPLAAFTSLSLTLGQRGVAAWMPSVALLSLALSTLVIGWLFVSTLKGLWRGSLLVPEPEPARLPPA
jgi:tellurite resistance protein